MNNIYKVIWSKAKNCYVVASEIARSHTKSASGSEKIGGVTRRKLLVSLMALSLLCGGLGVAEASVHVNEVPDGTKEVYTIGETYSRTEADARYAKANDVTENTTNIATNKANITALQTTATEQGKLIATNTANIANNTTAIEKKINAETANERFATKDALRDLKDTVDDKADATTVTTALGDKANTDLSNLTADGVNKIKETMSADMEKKANKDTVTALVGRVGGLETTVGGLVKDVTTLKTTVGDASNGLVKDVAELTAQGTTLSTQLGNKANQSDLVDATNRITVNEGNITALQNKTAKLSPDGKSLTDMDKVETDALKVTGQISNGTVNTTLAKIDASMTQTAANKDAIDTLQTITNGQADAIKDLKDRTTNISYDSGKRSTSINGIDIGDTQVDMNGKNLTDVGTINGIDLGTKQKGNYISQDGSIWGNMLEVDDQVKTNADAIAKETADRKAAIGELAVDGKYIKKGMNVSDNLVELDKQAKINADNIQTNANNIKNNKDEIARVNGELVKTNDYFNKELGKTNDYFNKELSKTNDYFNTELGKTNAALQEEGKARAEADAKINTKIGNIDDTRTEYVKNANSISQNLTTLDEKLQATNDRTGGIKRNTEDTQTTIEDKVTVNSSGDVGGVKGLSAETINTTGDAAIGGKLNVTGASDLKGDVTLGTPNGTNTVTVNGTAHFNEAANMNKGLNVTSGDTDLKNTTVDGTLSVNKETTLNGKLTANDEATFTKKVTMENDLEVKGELKTDKISMKNTDTDPDGTIHRSATTITADGITHNGEVEKSGVITKSQFTHTKEGSETYAKKGNTANWTETRSDVKADGVTTKVEDSKKNRTNTSQTADGIKGYATDKDGNKTYTKVTATENSFQVQDKDGKNKNHQVNTMGSSVTEIKNDEGKTTKTEQTAENITNTAKDGTIKNDAKDIVNNASGNISNKSQTMDTTVTGKATESYGSLDTTVNGNETHIVKGTKTETVDGKVTENYNAGQATKVTGNQDIHVTGKQTNTVEGGQENIISGGQINSITGDQTTTVTGDISNKAENITNEANTKLTDKVGDNTRVLDSEGITDTVPGADGKGSTFKQRIDAIMGNVKTDAGESEVTQKGDEITSVVGKGEATNSRVTQKKGSLETGVTDGTNTNASYDVANASAKQLTDGTKVNKVLDNLDSSEKTITNGTYTTSKLQTALDITNTAKDGTITNDAKNIVNNATGDMTNTVGGKLTTTVTGQATENFKGGLKTDITGEEIHTVTGNQTNKVTGKQSNTVEGGQENIISGGQINNITGDQTTTISGTQTTTARDINRNASSGMIDTIDNAYGTNTETKVAGKTTTDVSIKGTGEKGQYIRGANESRDYLIKGTLKNSETKTAEATSTEITDGNGKTSFTIQDVTQISGSVTDGTNTSVSNVKANSIDSAVTDGSSISTINQKKNSITSQVTDGTTITKTEQDTKNITNTAKDGTITNDAKDIVNNASGNMTNTVGGDLTTTVRGNELHEVTGKQTNKIDGDQENTIGGNQTTTVTGDISNKAENITNEANTKLTDKVGENTRVLDSEGITDTVGGSTFKQRIDKIMMESKDVSIKAEETLTNEAKVITNKASEVINNEAVNINNTATGIINSKASEIKNQADKLISNKVGENTSEYMEDGKITTSVKDGAKSTVTIQNADGLQTGVTNGTSTNASATTATSSAQTIASGNKANSVITTIDGTQFVNTDAAVPVTGASGAGTAVNTTIKGNTITTGKVTMDYADVMKDLGVRGNANITGKTTTGSLEVTGTSTLKGDVTMENNATVGNNLTVNGTTKTKTLNVTENAEVGGELKVAKKATFEDSVSIAKDLTVGGDVTAKSYKVGDKTYISADGINANDQKITNVADGSISEGSKDAVNGGQLYQVKNDLEGKVNKVGANAAAMANLHPMEFDPDSKWNIAAAMGNYGSETATAIGAFYRPNEDVMVNFSTAFGTGENMVGGGVSVRLGKGSNKLSRQESNALKAQVNDLTARMDALLSVLNPNMSKDFPDVPENHWAYEAVSRLAGNDIVQGYPDGEFHGDRTMTRYEMAEIIYNALSRGAEAEKELVEEFKPELQAMAASEKATAERAEG